MSGSKRREFCWAISWRCWGSGCWALVYLHVDTAVAIHFHPVLPWDTGQGSLLQQEAVFIVHLEDLVWKILGLDLNCVLTILGEGEMRILGKSLDSNNGVLKSTTWSETDSAGIWCMRLTQLIYTPRTLFPPVKTERKGGLYGLNYLRTPTTVCHYCVNVGQILFNQI